MGGRRFNPASAVLPTERLWFISGGCLVTLLTLALSETVKRLSSLPFLTQNPSDGDSVARDR